MELPLNYKSKLESLLVGYPLKELKERSFALSEQYRSGENNHITDELSLKVYAVSRYPATFKAFYTALDYSLAHYNGEIKSVIDVGAGSGAASLASLLKLDLDKVTLLEKESQMIEIGKYLFEGTEYSDKVCYQQIDVTKNIINKTCDMVVASYVLNELDDIGRINVVNQMWNMANKVVVIVEPGTPKGFKIIKQVRDYLISLGGHILAPCPHVQECPMLDSDWCHFSTRVMRSKLHKLLKGGDAPYEDEKFSYIAFSKEKCTACNSRVLRHPIINPGYVELELCSIDGIKKNKVTKKEKDKYKTARKLSVGDEF